MIKDVPSPIDLRAPEDAQAWEATAMSKRPYRTEVFAHFASAIASCTKPIQRVLELGSGPGFLAEHLLRALPATSYIALDFSAAMHELAAKRLSAFSPRVRFVERNFRESGWVAGLSQFDCVVTLQAVHELRHKRHACALHAQVSKVLAPAGLYLVCDHFLGVGGMCNDQLYMSIDEQRAALAKAGFFEIECLVVKGSLVLHSARSPL